MQTNGLHSVDGHDQMQFLAAKCPNCSGELRVPDNREKVQCMYCGADVLIRKAVAADGQNVGNWLKLAAAAAESENHREAYKYFTRVLEFEAENHIAHLGKGIAAGYLSTRTKFRSDELLRGLAAALKHAPEDQKQALRAEAADQIWSVCADFEIDRDVEESQLQRYGVISCLETAHGHAPEHSGILTSLYYEYDALARDCEAIHREYPTASSASQVEKCNRQAEAWLLKLEAVDPERAAKLRKPFDWATLGGANATPPPAQSSGLLDFLLRLFR